MSDMTDEEQTAALTEALGRELIVELAHAINNPNHALLLNLVLLRDVWSDLEPVLAEHARDDPSWHLAGVPWAEMRQAVPKLLDESLDCARRIREVVATLRDEADEPSSEP